MNCKQPDRGVPELVCGYPLPCPWHTVVIDTRPNPPTVTIPATQPKAMRPQMLGLLKEIANSIDPKSIKTAHGRKRKA